MKITERFDSVIMRHDLCRNEFEETIQQCVEVTGEYAIDFAEWMSDAIHRNYKSGGMWFVKGEIKTTKELLEIYKKEKGL